MSLTFCAASDRGTPGAVAVGAAWLGTGVAAGVVVVAAGVAGMGAAAAGAGAAGAGAAVAAEPDAWAPVVVTCGLA
jgi:hypothetical protein